MVCGSSRFGRRYEKKSEEMNHGSFCTIRVIRSGCPRETKCHKESVKKLKKSLMSLLWSVNGIQSFVDVPKGSIYNPAFLCDTVVSSLFDGITLHSRNHSKVYTSTWTMHIH
jgi:hypothetical protein